MPVEDPFLPRLPGFDVVRVPPVRAHKAYVCPECTNVIAEGAGHVVVWPVEQADERRHWHLHCWRTAARRGRIA